MTIAHEIILREPDKHPVSVRNVLFELARQIADAAAGLNFIKTHIAASQSSELMRADANRNIEKLHDIAELLAGDRKHEIYKMGDA